VGDPPDGRRAPAPGAVAAVPETAKRRVRPENGDTLVGMQRLGSARQSDVHAVRSSYRGRPGSYRPRDLSSVSSTSTTTSLSTAASTPSRIGSPATNLSPQPSRGPVPRRSMNACTHRATPSDAGHGAAILPSSASQNSGRHRTTALRVPPPLAVGGEDQAAVLYPVTGGCGALVAGLRASERHCHRSASRRAQQHRTIG